MSEMDYGKVCWTCVFVFGYGWISNRKVHFVGNLVFIYIVLCRKALPIGKFC